ncbi:von Willebrand factor type A domain-containing protein, partial [Echria macrotheca]
MSNSFGRIFAPGIFWDTREPLPPELQHLDQFHGRSHHDLRDAAGDTNRLSTQPFAPHELFPGIAPPTANVALVVTPTPKIEVPSFTVQEQGRNVLPPLSISLDASIIQDSASVTVVQTFWNDSSTTIKEASYSFPLPTGCTVTDLTCRIGANKIIRGDVKPKEEAREAFRHHIHHYNTSAALLEQDTPEIFTTTLGNIPEKTKLKINISYITVLKHRFADSKGTTTLTTPTYIAPRYGSPPDGYKGAEGSVPQGLKLKIEVIESKIQSLISNSHKILVKRHQGRIKAQSFSDLAGDNSDDVETAVVELDAGSMFLDKDFVLDIVTERGRDHEAIQAWLEEHPTIPNQKALMLTFPPNSLGQKADTQPQHGEILFLADRSGSMSDKIESLRSAMQFFLKGIPLGHKFNVWSFGSNFTSWMPQSVDYTQLNLNNALMYVDSTFQADMGGTELLPAIQAIVGARDKSALTDVIILTDGQTWRMDETLEFINQTRMRTEGRVRFFSLGIGISVSHALVDGIAKAGGGYAEVVPSSVRDGWEDRVVSMMKAALTTEHLGPLHFEFSSQDSTALNLSEAQRSPADISALSPFSRSRVYFLFESPGALHTITVKAPSGSNSNINVIPVNLLDNKGSMIHRLAARALLEDLERGQSHLHLGPNKPFRGTWAEDSQVRQEAEAIACKWSLVSKWTSFFLVEETYVPSGEDHFMDTMDGVVQVKHAAGGDLLRPRG